MDMTIRGKAASLTKGLPQKDFPGETQRLLEFVRDEIRYLKDIEGVETIHPAPYVLAERQGDCDDKAILLAALLLSIGHTPRFIATSFAPGVFSHVWVQDLLHIQGESVPRWVDLEPTEPIPFGERVPKAGTVKEIALKV